LGDWNNFFLGELGAAAALAGLLFVAVSVNQTKILQLGRMADRGLEALAMLMLVLIITSLTLIPGQSLRLLGGEILFFGAATMAAVIPLQRGYLRSIDSIHRRRTGQMVIVNRMAVMIIALAGLVILCRGDGAGLYLLPVGILLSFLVAMANTWVLLIEINR
jgi:modulator of FtsH protease